MEGGRQPKGGKQNDSLSPEEKEGFRKNVRFLTDMSGREEGGGKPRKEKGPVEAFLPTPTARKKKSVSKGKEGRIS